jgi:hypothetical protein
MLWFEDLIKDAKVTLDSRLGREMNMYVSTPEEAERRIAAGKKVVPLYARFDNA